MRIFAFLLLAFFASQTITAQEQPVNWSFTAQKTGDNTYDIILTADVANGWYVYSQFLDEGGPIPTSFEFGAQEGLNLIGETSEDGQKHEKFDTIFEMQLIKYDGEVVFVQKITTAGDIKSVNGILTFMTCNDKTCLPPQDVDFLIPLNE